MALSSSKFDIISWISFLVPDDIKNDSSHGLGRQWKGLKVCLIFDWMFGATEQKKY